jgi:TPR repeat protein
MYSRGDGVLKDPKEAIKWYKLSADQGHGIAQYELGKMYYMGFGVLKDPKKAAEWIKKSYEKGYEAAGKFWDKNELWKY